MLLEQMLAEEYVKEAKLKIISDAQDQKKIYIS